MSFFLTNWISSALVPTAFMRQDFQVSVHRAVALLWLWLVLSRELVFFLHLPSVCLAPFDVASNVLLFFSGVTVPADDVGENCIMVLSCACDNLCVLPKHVATDGSTFKTSVVETPLSRWTQSVTGSVTRILTELFGSGYTHERNVLFRKHLSMLINSRFQRKRRCSDVRCHTYAAEANTISSFRELLHCTDARRRADEGWSTRVRSSFAVSLRGPTLFLAPGCELERDPD